MLPGCPACMLPPARDDMCMHVPIPLPLPIEQKWQIQIMIVLVFILSRYWFKFIIFTLGCPVCWYGLLKIFSLFFEKWVPDRVPTWVPDRVPIIGPEGARKEKKSRSGTEEYVCLHPSHLHGAPHMHTCLPRRGNNLTKWNREMGAR